MRAPADDPAGGERRREHVPRYPAGIHHDPRVELDVGVERTPGLGLGEHRDDRVLHGGRELRGGPADRVSDLAQQRRARVLALVDPVAEAHDPAASPDRVADPGLGPVRAPDVVEHLEHAGGRAAVQRTGQGSHGPDDRGAEIRARGRDHPRGKRRGVEAVIDRGDQVPLQRPDVLRVRALAAEQVEVVGRGGQFRVRGHRLLPLVQPVQRREQHRRLRRDLHGVVVQLLRRDVQPGAEAGPLGEEGDRGAQRGQRIERIGGGQRAQERDQVIRQHAVAGDLALEAGPLGPVGQVAAEEQVPHVLERPAPVQLDGVVLPVVVETLQAADVTDPGVRDDHPLEPRGRVRAIPAVPIAHDLPRVWHLRSPPDGATLGASSRACLLAGACRDLIPASLNHHVHMSQC